LKLPNIPSIIELAQPTPEEIKGEEVWRELNDISWKKYLSEPFDPSFFDTDSFKKSLGEGLFKYLKEKTGSETAANQYDNSLISRQKLFDIINMDKIESERQGRKFSFFMRFSFEVFDAYGRLLCYLHKNKEKGEQSSNDSYNELLLESGYAVPYFIFPNVDPFIKFNSILDAIPEVGQDRFAFYKLIQRSDKLKKARKYLENIRSGKNNTLFTGDNALKLLPFELRILERREKPFRYVVDLSNPEPIIIPPEDYFLIRNVEDRFFIPEEYLPIFEKRGYKVVVSSS
jgi:hypothetical protein